MLPVFDHETVWNREQQTKEVDWNGNPSDLHSEVTNSNPCQDK
jgi:hypothetical protein